MKRNILFSALTAILMGGFSTKLVAQRNNGNSGIYVWVSGGLGLSSQNIGGKLEFSSQFNGHMLSLRLTGASEFNGILSGGPTPAQNEGEIAVLYGLYTERKSYTVVAASLGLGLVNGNRRGKFLYDGWFSSEVYENIPFSTVGIAFDFQANLTPLSVFGLGFDFLGNINPGISYFCLLVTVQIGKVN